MVLSEFDIIDRYFTHKKHRQDVRLSVGDDCALVKPRAHCELAMTTDTLVAGIHFLHDIDPVALGYKSLAVNLSDLAAMGAEPAWVLMGLTLPKINQRWLTSFAKGFFSLAKKYQVDLIGGDLTEGPLSITIQATGHVPKGQALCRHQAKVGDKIFVSGPLGNAAAALSLLKKERAVSRDLKASLMKKILYPAPRIKLGMNLRPIAHAAIDISDGLLADLHHILDRSRVGAQIDAEAVPRSMELIKAVGEKESIHYALTGGDEYELCFTVSKQKVKRYQKLLNQWQCSCIGEIIKNKTLIVRQQDGSNYVCTQEGFQHWRSKLLQSN